MVRRHVHHLRLVVLVRGEALLLRLLEVVRGRGQVAILVLGWATLLGSIEGCREELLFVFYLGEDSFVLLSDLLRLVLPLLSSLIV